jgi:iron complex outermembrane receptor protein
MRNHMLRDCLLASTMIAGAVVALPAIAQTAPAPAPQGTTSDDGAAATTPAISTTPSQDPAAAGTAEGGDIVVTGSRISNPNLTSASPVTVVNAADIKLRGATRIEDVLNSLPSAFAAQNSSVSNGSTGTATINLRNLGESRTLVLINGRRLMPGNPSSLLRRHRSSCSEVRVPVRSVQWPAVQQPRPRSWSMPAGNLEACGFASF